MHRCIITSASVPGGVRYARIASVSVHLIEYPIEHSAADAILKYSVYLLYLLCYPKTLLFYIYTRSVYYEQTYVFGTFS